MLQTELPNFRLSMPVSNDNLTNMYVKIFIFIFWFCAFLVTVLATNSNSTTNRMKKKFIPKKSTCGLNQLCSKAPFYPDKAIKILLRRNKKKIEYLSGNGNVIEPAGQIGFQFRGPDIEENICRTRKVSVMPRTAFDTKKRLKYIVNVEDLKQIITYETCVDPDKGCFGKEYWPNDFTTACKQVYTTIRLLSINHAGKMEYAYFPVPSNCVCTYKQLNAFNY